MANTNKNFFGIPNLYFSTYEAPKHYDYIPDAYKLNWEDPHKFIPDRNLTHFNQKMFVNFIHRECFNSCVQRGARLSENETNCYKSCQNKHLSSIGVFKEILMNKRKWKGFRQFVSLREYSRRPDEIATDIPTDPLMKAAYYNYIDSKQLENVKYELRNIFGHYEYKPPTIFEIYLQGKFTEGSNVEKNLKAQERADKYNEYKELSEKYGDQIKELLKKKVDVDNWKDVPGDNFTPEEIEAPFEASAGGDEE